MVMNGFGLQVRGKSEDDVEPEKEPVWIDVTEFVDQTVTEFKLGQVVHLDVFSWGDAMSALELMDPKMDAGMDPPEMEGVPVLPVKEYFSNGSLKASGFTDEEKLGIMDELIASLIRWFAADTLGQTVFTCLYLHQPMYLQDDTLRVFCLGLLKVCSLVRKEIFTAHVYEEEDYLFEPYTLPEMDVLTQDEAAQQLTEIEMSLSTEALALGTQGVRSRQAIKARISAVKDFLALITHMDEVTMKPLATISKTAAALRTHLATIKETLSLGIEADSRGKMLGFEPLINRKLSVHTLQKPTEFLTRERTVVEFLAIIDQLESIASLSTTSSFLDILNYLNYFAKRKPAPMIFTRSKLSNYLIQGGALLGREPLIRVIKDSVVQFSQSKILTLKNPKIARLTTNFLQAAVKVVGETFKVYCKNRARTRRKLKKLMVSWEGLQGEADHIDVEIDGVIAKVDPGLKRGSFFHYLTSWVYHHKTRVMLDWAWLGLETETYVPHEVLMVLWYNDCLQGAHLQNSQVVSQDITDPLGQRKEMGLPQEYLQLSDMPYQSMRQSLIRAILQILCGCRTQGLHPAPVFEFLDAKVHYNHRFAALARCGTPAPLQYEQYALNTTFTPAQAAELYQLAEGSLKVTKGSIDRCMKMSAEQAHMRNCQTEFQEEMKAMARVCISNTLVLKTIATHVAAVTKDPATPKQQVSLDFKYHPHFPVISLVPLK